MQDSRDGPTGRSRDANAHEEPAVPARADARESSSGRRPARIDGHRRVDAAE